MYKLEYLPLARNDMVEIATYISQKLCNITAANALANEMIEAADRLKEFPYSNAIYLTIKPLKQEYRKLIVQNYIMFYWITEEEKKITIARVIYARRNHTELLDSP